MQSESLEETPSGATSQESRRDATRVSVVWGRVVVGFILSTAGGVAFGHAWTVQVATWWWVGAISLLAGVLLLLSAAYARGRD